MTAVQCVCGRLFINEAALDDHIEAKGPLHHLFGTPANETVAADLSQEFADAEILEELNFAGIDPDEKFACGSCGWQFGERGVPKCVFCGGELVWPIK